MKIWHIAQYLSLLRVFLSPVAALYLFDIPCKNEILIAVVIIAGITDFLDGYMARKQGKMSYFGAILDFTADKVFILSVLVVLSIAGLLPIWITLIVLYREILVMGMRIYASYNKIEIKASMIGKWKTFIFFVAIVILLLGYSINYYLFVIGAALTLISFADYFNKFRKGLIEFSKTQEL